MKTLSKLSNNELSELSGLIGRINAEIENYLHVKDYLPKSLVTELNKFDAQLTNEQNKREDKY